jgi:hypothetical protein
MTFPNPSPLGPQGRRITITVTYRAWLHPDSFGPDTRATRRLAERGILPDADLPVVHEAYQPTVVRLVDLMTRHADPADTAVNARAMDALRVALTAGLMPEIMALVESNRLVNPEKLAEKLVQAAEDAVPDPALPPDSKIGFRREVEQAAEIVSRDPDARVILDGAIRNPTTGELEGADILDVTNKRAYQLKSVSNDKLRQAINAAADQLNGARGAHGTTNIRQKAPPGYRRIVVVYLEPAAGVFHAKDREELVTYLRRYPERSGLCADGRARVDSLVIVNAGAGIATWSKEEFGDIGQPC